LTTINQLKEQFNRKYGESSTEVSVFQAPGRVNLIGEHTDYNGGYVFPAALTIGTTMMARKREDGIFRFASTNFAAEVELDGSDVAFRKEDDWVNYPKGMIHHLKKRGYMFSGADILYHGEIPNGSGLSSSASIEVVTGYGLAALEGKPIDKVELALVAQEAENQFMRVNCGIMDQFAVSIGKKDHAIMLKCDNLDYELVPFKAEGYKLIIGNTNKRRGLVDSEYNARRAQCEEAVSLLKNEFKDLQYLCELTPQQFERSFALIEDEVVRRRAEHAITENDRVIQSVKALKANDLEQFGELMNDSHTSLKDLYEVTCFELDVMVEEARKIPGVLGSRMTGAGFGGCTVSLVAEESVEQFIAEVGKTYTDKTGLKAEFYVTEIGEGVRTL
jgi:galactokinase